MRPSLLPRLVNGPFEDPALFIRFLFENRAIMFDLGDIHALSTKDILKLTHVFVTHTHMDHFAGFDRLLRIFLGREKQLSLFGPQGFIRNVEGKLGGYQWNLVQNFTNTFSIKVTEVCAERLLSMTYHCQNHFQPNQENPERPFASHLLQEPSFTVSAVILDHRIPCLGLSIEEKFHVNIKKDALEALGLKPGPWIHTFKQALFEKQPPETALDIPSAETIQQFSLGALCDKIAMITPGQKISYVTDILYSPANVEKIIAVAKGSDQLYIEAAFMDTDRIVASQKNHLTAKQAGEIAALSRAKKIVPFHFSPRYTGKAHQLETEAMTAFKD
jgi:ribonuclease Z